jgi:hypothetical protein
MGLFVVRVFLEMRSLWSDLRIAFANDIGVE